MEEEEILRWIANRPDVTSVLNILDMPEARSEALSPSVDLNKVAQVLIKRDSELKALYKKLGYSPNWDQEALRLVRELGSLVRAGSPTDSDLFKSLLGELEIIFKGCTRLVDVPYPFDEEKLAKVLEERPELKELYEEVEGPRVLHPEPVRRDVIAKIAEVRDNLERKPGYVEESLHSLLDSLEESISEASHLTYNEDAEEKKLELDGLLHGLIYSRSTRPPNSLRDDSHFKESSAEHAKKYLDATWMHTAWLTTFLLTNLLDGYLAPLIPKPPKLPPEWVENAVGVAEVGMFSGLGLGLGLWLFGFGSDMAWGIGGGIIFVSFAVGALVEGSWDVRNWLYNRRLRKTGALQCLRLRNEVASGHYDGEEIARRLRRLEDTGLYVQTLVYALLRLQSRPTVS